MNSLSGPSPVLSLQSLVDCAVKGYQLPSIISIIQKCPSLTELELVSEFYINMHVCIEDKKWRESCLLLLFTDLILWEHSFSVLFFHCYLISLLSGETVFLTCDTCTNACFKVWAWQQPVALSGSFHSIAGKQTWVDMKLSEALLQATSIQSLKWVALIWLVWNIFLSLTSFGF